MRGCFGLVVLPLLFLRDWLLQFWYGPPPRRPKGRLMPDPDALPPSEPPTSVEFDFTVAAVERVEHRPDVVFRIASDWAVYAIQTHAEGLLQFLRPNKRYHVLFTERPEEES